MKILISLIAIFISVLFVQLGSGSLGPLDALSGKSLDFSSIEIGLIGSAHFFGFMVGCYLTPKLISRVGHSRAFASLASLGAISAILHMVLPNPFWWVLLRILSGISGLGLLILAGSAGLLIGFFLVLTNSSSNVVCDLVLVFLVG